MDNIKLADAPRAYRVSASYLERMLSKIGWLKNGEVQVSAKLYLTSGRELTPRGQGYLSEYLRE